LTLASFQMIKEKPGSTPGRSNLSFQPRTSAVFSNLCLYHPILRRVIESSYIEALPPEGLAMRVNMSFCIVHTIHTAHSLIHRARCGLGPQPSSYSYAPVPEYPPASQGYAPPPAPCPYPPPAQPPPQWPPPAPECPCTGVGANRDWRMLGLECVNNGTQRIQAKSPAPALPDSAHSCDIPKVSYSRMASCRAQRTLRRTPPGAPSGPPPQAEMVGRGENAAPAPTPPAGLTPAPPHPPPIPRVDGRRGTGPTSNKYKMASLCDV